MIAVSKQHQITLPKEFFDQLGIDEQIFIEFYHNRLIFRPVRDDDFSEEILKELVAKEFHGEELIKEFNYCKSQIDQRI